MCKCVIAGYCNYQVHVVMKDPSWQVWEQGLMWKSARLELFTVPGVLSFACTGLWNSSASTTEANFTHRELSYSAIWTLGMLCALCCISCWMVYTNFCQPSAWLSAKLILSKLYRLVVTRMIMLCHPQSTSIAGPKRRNKDLIRHLFFPNFLAVVICSCFDSKT